MREMNVMGWQEWWWWGVLRAWPLLCAPVVSSTPPAKHRAAASLSSPCNHQLSSLISCHNDLTYQYLLSQAWRCCLFIISIVIILVASNHCCHHLISWMGLSPQHYNHQNNLDLLISDTKLIWFEASEHHLIMTPMTHLSKGLVAKKGDKWGSG